MPAHLLEWFSTRTGQVEARYQLKLDRFRSTMGREPSRREDWRLKREAAADSRPPKHRDLTLSELQCRWTGRVARLGLQPEQLVAEVIGRQIEPAGVSASAGQVLVHDALVELQDTVSTWRRNDVIREIARRIPTVTTVDAQTLTDWVGKAADGGLERLIELTPAPAPGVPTRADGRPITESTLDRPPYYWSHLERGRVRGDVGGGPLRGPRRDQSAGADRRFGSRPSVRGPRRRRHRSTRARRRPRGYGQDNHVALRRGRVGRRGRPVFGLAPSASAAAVLTAQTGIRSDTIDKLLYEHHRPGGPLDPMYRLPTGTTVIVDEAGMLATPSSPSSLDSRIRITGGWCWSAIHISWVPLGAVDCSPTSAPPAVSTNSTASTASTNRGKRAASLRLRMGDADVLAAYDKHDRLHDGTSGDMTGDILTAWCAARSGGESVADAGSY